MDLLNTEPGFADVLSCHSTSGVTKRLGRRRVERQHSVEVGQQAVTHIVYVSVWREFPKSQRVFFGVR